MDIKTHFFLKLNPFYWGKVSNDDLLPSSEGNFVTSYLQT